MIRLFEFAHGSTAAPSRALRPCGLLIEDIECKILEASAYVLSLKCQPRYSLAKRSVTLLAYVLYLL